MSNLKYLKGVRTRYYNILEKDVNSACSLLKEQYEIDGDKQALLSEVCVHIERLQTYSNKLESQSEKVTSALDGDEEYIEEILREDTELCDSALKLCSELKKCEHHIREELETDQLNQSMTDSKSTTDENFHKLMEMQLQLQKQVLATSEKTKESSSQIKLPKLEIRSFSGDRLQWIEFWQSFENSIHKNKSLSGLEKFNYLRSKLTGEAKGAIAGLALSNENYQPAVDILKERYGNIQETIDLHYNRIINLKPANDSVESLRYLLDTVNKNLRSLEDLGQNVNQDIFVSVVKTKLPVNVVRHLEIQKGSAIKWTVQMLRDLLTEYVSACEKAEKVKRDSNTKEKIPNNTMKTTVEDQNHSTAEALAVNDEDKSKRKFQCRYCAGSHWSDECPKYKTIKERKKCLKGSCYKCLKQGHKFDECKSQKTCVYCKEVNVHHRSLCPKKFKETFNRESAHVAGENNNLVTEQNNEESDEEEALMSSNESVLMQTAQTVITDPLSKKEQKVRILLDSGSQRTYISEQLAKSMDLQRGQQEEIRLVTFGSDKTKVMKTFPTKLNLRFKSGEELAISANVVPNITGTIHRKPVNLVNKKTFKDLTENLVLADDIPKEKEADRVDLLIGNDYYLDLVTGHKIEVQPGLYLLSSKLGWILTGRTQEVDKATKDISMLIMTHGNNITETEVFTDVDKEIPRKPDL